MKLTLRLGETRRETQPPVFETMQVRGLRLNPEKGVSFMVSLTVSLMSFSESHGEFHHLTCGIPVSFSEFHGESQVSLTRYPPLRGDRDHATKGESHDSTDHRKEHHS